MSDTQNNQEEKELTLTSHLVELRQRLIRALLFILAIFLCLFYFANDLYTFFALPIQTLLPQGTSMIATEVTAPFFAPFKLTLILFVYNKFWS